ncbi:MAG: hypothetical protein GXY50_11390 [Syntrophomonadaceae bacterium]|nr:hypothetical protein [Syntrophomonadaceae bacterium]
MALKRKSKTISILLTLAMLCMLWPGVALAEGEDTTPPEWAASYPSKANICDTQFHLRVKSNEAGKAYYVRLADKADPPTEEQIKAGTDAGNVDLGGYPAANSVNITADKEYSFKVAGLAPNMSYDVYTVLEDAEGNTATVGCVEVTTTIPNPTKSTVMQTQQEEGSKKVTLTITVKNEEEIASPGYKAEDFSVKVDSENKTFNTSPFSNFYDPDTGAYTVYFMGADHGTAYTFSDLSVKGNPIKNDSFTVTTPPPVLDTPADITWDDTTPGKAKWTAVNNVLSYSVQLYKGGNPQGAAIPVPLDTTEHDFTAAIAAAGDGSYTFKVTAIGDGINFGDSPISSASPEYNYAAEATPISISAIAGVTAPVTGAAPVTGINGTEQYTGTVLWSPADDPFKEDTAYTATITLTPQAGYTLTGVTENFFTVAGATATNAADFDVVTAVFPSTAPAAGGPIGNAVWNIRSPLPSANIIEDVKYINGQYMAVGYNGTLITSTNGITWSKVDIETDIDRLGGIAYGGGKYVIVGYVDIPYGAARIYTSDDGVSWSQTAAVPHHYLYDVAYGKGKFVAVGQSGKILVSSNGETWTTHEVTYPVGKSTTLLSITYSDAASKFVAAGMGSDSGQHECGIMTSEDGEKWTVTYSEPANVSWNYTLWDVTNHNGTFVAVGGRTSGSSSGYFIVTSSDGENWTTGTSGSAAQLFSVDYDGSKFIAAGSTQSGNKAFIATSADGGTWSNKTDSGRPGFRAIASNNEGAQLVAMAGYGNIYTSDNGGTSWEYRTLGTTKTLKDVAWNGSNLYVAVGVEGTIQTSANGVNWTSQTSGTTNDLNKVDYLNNQFVAVGKGGTIVTSTNGIDWTLRTSGTAQELKGIAYGDGKYVIVGGDAYYNPVVLTSDDGITWSTVSNDPAFIGITFVTVTYGDGVFMALMQNGQVYRSGNGTDWDRIEDLPGVGAQYPTDIIYANGKFIAVGGYGNTYLSSNKGDSWTSIQSRPDNYFWGVTYGGGNLVAVGQLGRIKGSADGGTTWLLQPSGLKPNHYSSNNFIQLNGITAGDNCFVAVGENGLVLQSQDFTVSADGDAHDVTIARTALDINNILGSGSNANAGLIVANMKLQEEDTISGSPPIVYYIDWSSSKPEYVATDGKVTRPAFNVGDQVVFLTATIRKGAATDQKTFVVVVLAQTDPDISDVEGARAALTFDTIKGSNTAANNIVSNLNLGTIGANGTTISWTSNQPAYIATNGTVTRPAQGSSDQVVTLTATITKGAASGTRTFNLTVKAMVDADAQAVADAKAALTFETIKGSNTAENNIVSNLNLGTIGANGTTISWTSNQPAYIAANGTVIRPAQGSSDQAVTLTATITKGAASDTKTFTLTVKAMVDADAQAVADAKAALTFDTIKGSNTAANNIVSNLNLGTIGANGTTISWTSDKPAYIATNGTVTRPAQGAGNELVTLTATITKGAASDTKTFTFTVTGPSSGSSGGGSSSSAPSGILVTPSGRDAADTGVNLSFPAGAVESDIRVQVRNAALTSGMSLPADSQLISKVVDIVKDRSGSFSQPVTITMSFNKSQIDPDKYYIKICCFDEESGEWVDLDNIQVNLNESTVSGQVNHFTKFAVIATLKPSDPPSTPEPKLPADAAGHWAGESIARLIEAGIVSGYPDGSFQPDKTVTRAEFTVMLAKALKLEQKDGPIFKDTAAHWAKDTIASAAAYGLVKGYDQNSFGPNDMITREQAAVMIAGAAKLEATQEALKFNDAGQISAWAVSGVAAAVKGNCFKGYPDNSFRPQAYTSRAEAVAIIAKLL